MMTASFGINVAGAAVNGLAFAIYHAPISGACAILNGLLALIAVLAMETQDVRNSRF